MRDRGGEESSRGQTPDSTEEAFGDRPPTGHQAGFPKDRLSQVLDVNGAESRTRTDDPCFTKALLYQLSYPGPGGGKSSRFVDAPGFGKCEFAAIAGKSGRSFASPTGGDTGWGFRLDPAREAAACGGFPGLMETHSPVWRSRGGSGGRSFRNVSVVGDVIVGELALQAAGEQGVARLAANLLDRRGETIREVDGRQHFPAKARTADAG